MVAGRDLGGRVKGEEEDSGFSFWQGMLLGGGSSGRIQKGERGLDLHRVPPAWDGDKAQESHSMGHSLVAVSCSSRWEQRAGSWRGKQPGGGSEFPCLVLQMRNPGWSGLKSPQLPPPLSLLPAALKSPVASLLPDVASRCGLELFQVDQGWRGSSQAPGFSSSLLL